ncbi:MAG: hypothetical protein JXJ04_17540 [Spirochaetales bacterium]|nr:hypothetical protein [Spirochaetales bacterium]
MDTEIHKNLIMYTDGVVTTSLFTPFTVYFHYQKEATAAVHVTEFTERTLQVVFYWNEDNTREMNEVFFFILTFTGFPAKLMRKVK